MKQEMTPLDCSLLTPAEEEAEDENEELYTVGISRETRSSQ